MTAKQAKGLMAPDGSQYTTLTDGAGNLADIAVTLDAADIEIGAVEIKNATTDDRVSVSAAGAMKVDASSVAVPITDNSGSLTVDNAGTFAVQSAATQSGTWTVQPGNTANTTAWKVDGSAVTQPISVASIPSHAVTNAGTFAVQAAEADGANVTLGAKADAKSTATDTTSISAMSVLKQISASVQAPPSQAVTNAGTFAVQLPTAPATGTMSSVASSASSVTVLASNASRKGASVYNDSTQVLYLAVSATTASSTAYTAQLAANAFFELPPCRDGSVYTGQLTGIWASANGNARVTEWT